MSSVLSWSFLKLLNVLTNVIILQENKKLAEPLKKAREELTDLKRQLGSQEKQKGALVAARAKLKVCDKDIENLKWELEVLQQKYDRAVRKFKFTVRQ